MSPLRSREEPLGLSALSPQEAAKVFHANRAVEICTWFLDQATQSSVRKVGVLLVFPEDLGGHIRQLLGTFSSSADWMGHVMCSEEQHTCAASPAQTLDGP